MDFALFSPSSLFADTDGASSDEETTEMHQSYVERRHQFPGMELLIREFTFHELNANLLWPGTFSFAECGTGALAIFLRKSFQLDITTSDYDDQEIAENIAHNCGENGISPVLPHIKHSWGDAFPSADPDWDLIIASDILLYVKQYANLIKTLSFLLKSYKPKVSKAFSAMNSEHNGDTCLALPYPAFLMSWRRRIGKEDESLFFNGCENAGLQVQHLGSRVYCIKPCETSIDETT
ncbi:Protein N-methyltransferase [Actinidia chinensis var. chinensis]|uniref:Protein N-methyltransferase n=1 Tax=Actinidia chinensis var. chinensis TaxID=1590841 RepID=A0A2R6RXB4_ACTCC|nr:Protein N-methyltransferase [Actinidia chinensis var. chinensis]